MWVCASWDSVWQQETAQLQSSDDHVHSCAGITLILKACGVVSLLPASVLAAIVGAIGTYAIPGVVLWAAFENTCIKYSEMRVCRWCEGCGVAGCRDKQS